MKKLFSTIALLASVAYCSQAQVNNYFDLNPVWHCDRYSSFSGSDCTGEYLDKNYSVGGDTVWSGNTYKKINFSYMHYDVNAACFNQNPVWHPSAPAPFLLRNNGRQMFIKTDSDINESLLYDFDLAVGDTVPPLFLDGGLTRYITAIDSFATPAGFRLILTCQDGLKFYEGVGASGGLESGNEPLFLSGTNSLICFSMNGTVLAPNGTCDMSTGIHEISTALNTSVSPMPFDEHCTISTTMQGEKVFRLYDLQGKLLRTESFNTAELLLSGLELKNGLYIYSIDNGGQFVRGKMTAAGR